MSFLTSALTMPFSTFVLCRRGVSAWLGAWVDGWVEGVCRGCVMGMCRSVSPHLPRLFLGVGWCAYALVAVPDENGGGEAWRAVAPAVVRKGPEHTRTQGEGRGETASSRGSPRAQEWLVVIVVVVGVAIAVRRQQRAVVRHALGGVGAANVFLGEDW